MERIVIEAGFVFALLLCLQCKHSSQQKEFTYTNSEIDNINIISKSMYDKGFVEVGSFSRYGEFRHLTFDTVVAGKDTLMKCFCGYEIRTVLKVNGEVDTVPGFRLYMQFDSLISSGPFNFNVEKQERIFPEQLKKLAYGKEYRFFPKDVAPEIYWKALVSPSKCVDITLHVFPVCQIPEADKQSVLNELLLFISKRKIESGEVDSLMCKIDNLHKLCKSENVK